MISEKSLTKIKNLIGLIGHTNLFTTARITRYEMQIAIKTLKTISFRKNNLKFNRKFVRKPQKTDYGCELLT